MIDLIRHLESLFVNDTDVDCQTTADVVLIHDHFQIPLYV